MAERDPCCDVPYPLGWGGTTADGRAAAALDPASVRLDPRDMPGLLRWVMVYASYLRHHDALAVDGAARDGVPFRQVFGVDPLIALAEMAAMRPERAAVELIGPHGAAARSAWTHRLRRWADSAPRGSEMATTLARAARSFPAADIDGQRAELERLVDRAADWWAVYAADWPRHAPHVALVIAALRLYRHPQALLDAFVGRHLNYGYETVLGLTRRLPEPDRAHVIIELARHVTAYALPAGAVFLGKDGAGQPARFALTEEVGFGRATVAEACGVIVGRDEVDLAVYAEPLEWPRPAALGWPNAPTGSTAPLATVGLAVASPILSLSGGARTITITIELQDVLDVGEWPSFQVRYSAPTGWHDVAVRSLEAQDDALIVTAELSPDDPPVVPTSVADGPARFATDLPLFQLRFTDCLPAALYAAKIGEVEVAVVVDRLRPSSIRGPGGSGDPEGTFMPFGPQPRKGDAFYIDHPELCDRPLNRIALSCRSVGPTNLTTIYAGYDAAPGACRLEFQGWQAGSWATLGDSFDWAGHESDARVMEQEFDPPRILDAPNRRSALRWVLGDDLKHDDWARVLAEKAAALAAEMQQRSESAQTATAFEVAIGTRLREELASSGVDRVGTFGKQQKGQPGSFDDLLPLVEKVRAHRDRLQPASDPQAFKTVLPGPPMVLRAAELSLGYTASTTAFGGDAADGALFHIGPLGAARAAPGDGPLPPLHTASAALYIGLAGLTVPTALTLLIQVLEGSEDPAASGPEVQWHALTTEGWGEAIEPLRDSTGGLLRSGLVRLQLPSNVDPDPVALPGGLSWLRLTIPWRSDGPPARQGVCTVLDVRAQAAEVVRIEATEAVGAPPEAITRLAERRAEIRAVQQPYAAFGGRPGEGDADFHRRVAERLRHKDRAITPWDYERLVLDAFPDVFKVRCLVHSRIDTPSEGSPVRRHAPGHVTLVLVGRLPDRFAADPLRPRVSAATRLDITRFVEARAPIGATVHVVDAHYVPVTVTAHVLFEPGAEGYGSERVQAALRAHLAPWTAAAPVEPAFGGEVHASRLLAVIDAVPGVVAADRLTLDAEEQKGRESYRPEAPHVVITSASAHTINREEGS